MSIGETMKDLPEVLDGLKEIKDLLDPKGEMSWGYFKRNLLPGLREVVLIEEGYRGCREVKYVCFKSQLMAYFLLRGVLRGIPAEKDLRCHPRKVIQQQSLNDRSGGIKLAKISSAFEAFPCEKSRAPDEPPGSLLSTR